MTLHPMVLYPTTLHPMTFIQWPFNDCQVTLHPMTLYPMTVKWCLSSNTPIKKEKRLGRTLTNDHLKNQSEMVEKESLMSNLSPDSHYEHVPVRNTGVNSHCWATLLCYVHIVKPNWALSPLCHIVCLYSDPRFSVVMSKPHLFVTVVNTLHQVVTTKTISLLYRV